MGSVEVNNEFLLDIGRVVAVCVRAGLIGKREPKSEFRREGVAREVVKRDIAVCGIAGLIGSLELNSELLLFVEVDDVDEADVCGRAGLIGRLELSNELSSGTVLLVPIAPCGISVSCFGPEPSFDVTDTSLANAVAAGGILHKDAVV